jgi:hypothetical protein
LTVYAAAYMATIGPVFTAIGTVEVMGFHVVTDTAVKEVTAPIIYSETVICLSVPKSTHNAVSNITFRHITTRSRPVGIEARYTYTVTGSIGTGSTPVKIITVYCTTSTGTKCIKRFNCLR